MRAASVVWARAQRPGRHVARVNSTLHWPVRVSVAWWKWAIRRTSGAAIGARTLTLVGASSSTACRVLAHGWRAGG